MKGTGKQIELKEPPIKLDHRVTTQPGTRHPRRFGVPEEAAGSVEGPAFGG